MGVVLCQFKTLSTMNNFPIYMGVVLDRNDELPEYCIVPTFVGVILINALRCRTVSTLAGVFPCGSSWATRIQSFPPSVGVVPPTIGSTDIKNLSPH